MTNFFVIHPIHVTFTFTGSAGDGTQCNEYQKNTLLLNTFSSVTKFYEFPTGSPSDRQINFSALACTPCSLIFFFLLRFSYLFTDRILCCPVSRPFSQEELSYSSDWLVHPHPLCGPRQPQTASPGRGLAGDALFPQVPRRQTEVSRAELQSELQFGARGAGVTYRSGRRHLARLRKQKRRDFPT